MAETRKPRNLIADLAAELTDRSHGEIFDVYYTDTTDEMNTLEDFIESLKEQCEDVLKEEPDNVESRDIHNLIIAGKNAEAILQYFDYHPNHAEFAGFAIGACWVDGNFVLAQQIFDKLDESGFDS
jgi:hypothetical protein